MSLQQHVQWFKSYLLPQKKKKKKKKKKKVIMMKRRRTIFEILSAHEKEPR
jgi:hypothetical protein